GTTDYSLECIENCEVKLYPGLLSPPFGVVKLTNKLGFTETFELRLDQKGNENVLNCVLKEGNFVTLQDGEEREIKLSCKPVSQAAGNEYTIEIISRTTSLQENLEKSKTIKLKVLECIGVRDIVFYDRSDKEISSNSINAGKQIKLKILAEGCKGKNFNLAVNHTEYVIRSETLTEDSYYYPGKQLYSYVSTPGTYTFYVWVDVNSNNIKDEGEVYSESLTVNNPLPQSGKDCSQCNQICSFSNKNLCTYWYQNWDCLLGCRKPCSLGCDPQSCKIENLNDCTNYSSVCCISENDTYYSNGPGIPCFSLDNLKEFALTKNFWWGGYKCEYIYPSPKCDFTVYNTKNILVEDGMYAIFENDWPASENECRGIGFPYPSNPPEDLGSAQLTTISTPLGNHNACKLSDDLPPYSTWIYVKISEISRPVYGVIVSIYVNELNCDWWLFPVLTLQSSTYSKFHIFLHNSSGWINAGTFEVEANNSEVSKTITITPQNEFAWKNIDAILIAHAYTYSSRLCLQFTLPYVEEKYVNGYIDYVGLLTADRSTPFCTDGPGNFNRIVNDASTCYWGLDCPISGNGWVGNKTTATGFLGECNCSSGTCGYGYCEKEINGNRFCFSGVKCMNGGWVFEKFEKCEAGNCTAEGCK
ncbi:MAG: hypothetical protein QW228_09575, partial [Candidatus Aenigmatarchaeota archaeon]